MTSAMQRRLAALEVRRRLTAGYVVRLPDGALGDPDAEYTAIMEHRRRTGWLEPVILAPPEKTQSEWLAKYGRVTA